MELDLEATRSLSPGQVRQLLPAWLATTVVPAASLQVQQGVAGVLEVASQADLATMLSAFSELGREYRLYPADPLMRRVSRAYMAALALPGSQVHGVAHLRAALAAGPVLLLGNHRSYVDTQLTDLLLSRQDPALADRLVTVAGPKVYRTPFRRVAALGLSTIQTAQSSTVASEGAELDLRQVARIAASTVHQAHDLMQQGYPVLLYPEGTRTRTGRLGPFLRGAGRYARLDGVQILPLALSGSEKVMPIDASKLSPAVVTLTLGEAFAAEGLGKDGVLAEARRRLEGLLG